MLAAVQTRYDAINGGFGGAPKFPPSLRLEMLMATAERFADSQVHRIVLHSLERMAAGGIYDQIAAAFTATPQTPSGKCRTSRRCSTTKLICRGCTCARTN